MRLLAALSLIGNEAAGVAAPNFESAARAAENATDARALHHRPPRRPPHTRQHAHTVNNQNHQPTTKPTRGVTAGVTALKSNNPSLARPRLGGSCK